MDESDDDYGPAFPLTVTIAGWVWVVHGVVLAIVSCITGSVITYYRGAGPNGPLVIALGGTVGWLVVSVGRRAVTGIADDLLWPAAVSFLVGLLVLSVLLMGAANVPIPNYVHLVVGAPATSLVAAGLLAVLSRGAYLRWRDAARWDADAEG